MELTQKEEKFLQNLKEYAEATFGNKWRDALKDNIPVPEDFEEAFRLRLDTDHPEADEAFRSLVKKDVIQLEEKKEEFNHSQWRLSQVNGEKREKERTGKVRGKRNVRYLHIPEKMLEELDL